MKIKTKFKINLNILDYIFLCIIANIFPTFLLGMFDISNTVYTMLYIIIYLLQSVIFFFLCFHKFKYMTKYELIFLGICIINCIFPIVCDEWENNSINIKDLIFAITVIYNTLIFVICAKKFQVCEKDIISFFKKMVIIGIISVIINLTLNFRYLSSLSIITNSYNLKFSSFFPNRNQFGLFMLMIIISNSVLMVYKNDKFLKLLQFVFGFNLIFSMSRNSMMGLVVYYVVFNFYKYITKRQSISKNAFGALVIVIISILSFVIKFQNNTNLKNILNTLFFRLENIKSGSGRFDVWQNGILIVKETNLMFGVGRYKAIELNNLLFNNGLEHFHSLYIEKFVSHGLVGIIWLISLLKGVWSNIKNISPRIRDIFKSAFISFLVFSIFETTTRFSIGYGDTIFMIFFISVPLVLSNNCKNV